jgi:hypothetical protein
MWGKEAKGNEITIITNIMKMKMNFSNHGTSVQNMT